MRKPALLALADGSLFRGESIGADGQTVGEVVFNTSITGYQEILTDPSYYRQIVTLTYPHIGNVGTNPADRESEQVFAQGLVVRACSPVASNWRSRQSLEDYLLERGVVGISDIDTRRLTRLLREKGAQNGCLMAGDHLDPQEAQARARAFPGLKGMGLAGEVSTPEPYTWREGSWRLEDNGFVTPLELPLHVVAYDFGVKYSSLRKLVDRGCRVTVVPATTPADQVLAMDPDGVYLSNGPGDPQPCDYAIQAIQTILTTDLPVFGICLGHQLLGLASGAATVKMKFGHHGGNHPVQDLDSGRVMISSQNHGFAVDEATLPADLRPTHRSLFDGTLQGVARRDRVVFGFQGHPEAGPGPNDLDGLFDRFVAAIAERKRRVA